MNWSKINGIKTLVVSILILFVNLNIKAETEAERRASERRLQEIVDRDEKKTQQEADRIYHEKYGPGKTDYSKALDTFLRFFLTIVLVAFSAYSIIEFSQQTDWSQEIWPKNRNWNPKYGSKADYEKIIYKGQSPSYNDQSEKWFLRFLKGEKRIKPTLDEITIFPEDTEDTGDLNKHTWESHTVYKKIFFQNRDKITGSIDIKEYYKLVVEYNLCSCVERRSEIADIFTERNLGKPFLKQFQRKPFKSEKAESNRKRIDQMRLLFLPCPECLTDIDCNDAKEGVTYSCHRCAAYYKFKTDVGLLIC